MNHIALLIEDLCVHSEKILDILLKSQYRVTIISRNKIRYKGVRNIDFPLENVPFKHFRWFLRVFKYFMKEERSFDLLHVFWGMQSLGWVARLAFRGKMLVSTIGSDVFYEEQLSLSFFEKKTLKSFYNAVSFVSTLTPYMKQFLEAEGIKSEKISLVSWGVHNIYQRVGCGERRASEQVVVFSPRLLKPFYNIDIIIQAFASLQKDYPEASLVQSSYGYDAYYKDFIVGLIKKLQLKNVTLLDPSLEISDVAKVYRESSLTVMLPESDGCPSSMIESMYVGTPVIALDLPHYREIVVHKKTGFLVKKDCATVYKGMKEILENHTLAQSIRDRALAQGEKKFFFNNQLKVYEEIFKKREKKAFLGLVRFSFWFILFFTHENLRFFRRLLP